MQSLEHQAHSFFLRCRSRPWQQRPRRACHGAVRSSSHAGADRSQASRTSNTEPSTVKPFYVTTPIYYVNSSPHAGHLYSMVLADIFKRWHQLKQRPAQLLTGTDEHGIKVQRAAHLAGADIYPFCTQHARQFQSLANTANISYDRFFRTTDQDHKEAVRFFWQELDRQGYIYQAKHEGWYCVSDETFYPESQVHMVLEPSTGDKIMASMETGKEVIWTSEINYHFELSAFRDRLLQHYERHPDFIVPKQRMNFIISEVKAGLSDLSISRPRERLSWGIRVPGDETQTIYVWFDALINYITHAGYPFSPPDDQKFWPADVQVIGKDIIRFHTIYWPAFLMALGLPLPKQFLSHAHWTMNTQKMSKSLGNVVNPFSAMSRFGVDAIRYYMARDGGIVDDAPYENFYIVKRYKGELQGQIGNLLNRVVRSKLWDASEIVTKCRKELLLPQELRSRNAEEFVGLQDKFADTVQKTDAAMQALDIRRATDGIFNIIVDANRLVQQMEPWKLSREASEESQTKLQWTVFAATESLRIVLILLQPVMPAKMKFGLDMLGVPTERRFLTNGLAHEVPLYGQPMVDVRKGSSERLFPPLLSES